MTNKTQKKFTPEETEFCIKEFKSGKSLQEIANALDRTVASVKSKLNREKNLNPDLFKSEDNPETIKQKNHSSNEIIQLNNVFRSKEEVESVVIELINNEKTIDDILSISKFQSEDELNSLLNRWKNEVM